MLRIGIRSSSAVNSSGIFDLKQLALAKETGFDIVELNFNHPRTGLDCVDEKQGKEFREKANRLSICLLAHAPEICITCPDKDKARERTGQYGNALRGMAQYGVESAVIHACAYQPAIVGRENRQMENFIEALKSLAGLCEEYRIRVLVETMVPGCITSSMDNLIAAVDAVGSPWVGICVDTNHLNLSHDLSSAMAKAEGRIGEFHLNDNHGRNEEHLLPYCGIIDWNAFVKAVKSIDYGGYFILEPGVMLIEAYKTAQRLQKALDMIETV